MIKLADFIKAIQEAVLRANEALIESGHDSIVEKFFDRTGNTSADLGKTLDDALNAIRNVKDRESLQDAIDPLTKARDALTGGDKDSKEALSPDPTWRAKTVTVEYPMMVNGKVEFKDVHVPLITLVPLNFSSIEEVKLQTDVELSVVDEELQISFGKVRSIAKWLKMKQRAPGRLEITIKPDEGPDGVKVIVDGYERVLKAQIPS